MIRDEYWQEAFEIAMDDAGCGSLLSQMTKEQREEIGGALCGAAECQGMAFPTPPNPLIAETARLERKLKWERELEICEPCRGAGRLRYNSGPWAVDEHCSPCSGSGKVHPCGEARPS